MSPDRYRLAETVIGILEQPLADEGFELLDVRVFRGGGRLTLRVYLDRPGGVSVDDCAVASRSIGLLLEEADPVAEAYVLEVSSPGVRRPLRTPAHYAAAVGQDVVLRLDPASGRDRLRGRLVSSDAERLVLDVVSGEERRHTELTVPLARVREANLDPEFDAAALIRADRRRRKEERRRRRAERRQARRDATETTRENDSDGL